MNKLALALLPLFIFSFTDPAFAGEKKERGAAKPTAKKEKKKQTGEKKQEKEKVQDSKQSPDLVS